MKIVINQILLLLLFTFLSACSGNDAEVSSTEPAKSPDKANQQKNYRIGTYFSPDRKLSGNSYWVEGPDGLILIDTQFLVQDTLELLQIAESITGKKVKMAIVLQPTAQRFNGVAALVARGIRVVSSSQVVDAIPRVDKESREKWGADFAGDYPGDYPPETVLPEAMWDKTQEFDAVGLKLKAYIVRDAVSEAHLLIGLEDSLFVGDIVTQGEHVEFTSIPLKRWLERIEEIRKFVTPKVIYPGKGYAMGGDVLLKQQQDYLEVFRKAISEYYTGGKISQVDVRDIVRKIKLQYPRFKNAHLLEDSVISAWESKRQADHEMFDY